MSRILVVDDDAQIRRLLSKILERAGFSTMTAADGLSALEMLRSEPVDLVITDIMMPDQDGIQTIIELRRERPGLRIVAISGTPSGGRIDYLEYARKLGADRVLKKPFEFETVLTTVRELLSEPATTET